MPILDCSTRWNSTYLMIQRAQRLRPVFRSFFVMMTDLGLSELQLSDHEWRQAEYLIQLLHPFWLYTKLLSVQKTPMIHRVCGLLIIYFNL